MSSINHVSGPSLSFLRVGLSPRIRRNDGGCSPSMSVSSVHIPVTIPEEHSRLQEHIIGAEQLFDAGYDLSTRLAKIMLHVTTQRFA